MNACDDGFLNWQLLTFSAMISPLQPSHSNLISFVLHVVFFIIKMHRSLQDKADFRYAVMICAWFLVHVHCLQCLIYLQKSVRNLRKSTVYQSRGFHGLMYMTCICWQKCIYQNVNKMFCLSCWRWCKPCFEDFLFMYYTTWKVSVKCRIINTEQQTTWRN